MADLMLPILYLDPGDSSSIEPYTHNLPDQEPLFRFTIRSAPEHEGGHARPAFCLVGTYEQLERLLHHPDTTALEAAEQEPNR